MQKQAKRMAAAMAAVRQYLDQEEAEAAARQQSTARPAGPCAVEPGPWAHSGLIDMMAGRRMVQMRALSNPR